MGRGPNEFIRSVINRKKTGLGGLNGIQSAAPTVVANNHVHDLQASLKVLDDQYYVIKADLAVALDNNLTMQADIRRQIDECRSKEY